MGHPSRDQSSAWGLLLLLRWKPSLAAHRVVDSAVLDILQYSAFVEYVCTLHGYGWAMCLPPDEVLQLQVLMHVARAEHGVGCRLVQFRACLQKTVSLELDAINASTQWRWPAAR